MANLRLPDAMDSAKALLYAIWIPGKIVIDHEIGILEVDTFASGVSRQQNPDHSVISKQFLNRAPFIAMNSPMNNDYGFFAPQEITYLAFEIMQSIPVLCENDQLPLVTASVSHDGFILQESGKLIPLAVFV